MNNLFSPILFLYMARRFLGNFLIVFGTISAIALILEIVELMRRLAKYNNFTLGRVTSMSLLKLPEVILELMPFAILIAAVLTFWRLTRTSELVVIRAAGISAWQFLFAPLVLGLMIALLKIALINPLSVALISRFEQMEAKYLSVSDSTVNIARTGLWLRQKMSNGQIAIIHAQGVKMPEWSFHPVTAFFFDTQNQLTYRIDAEQATIDNGEWIFTKAWSNKITHDLLPDVKTNRYYNILRLPTPISLQDIQSRFASPRTIPFWSLPDYAHIMEETGFESHMLWAHFYNLLAEPILNVALILLAASLSLRAPRLQRGWWLVGMTIGTGFIVFFLGDFLQALGISERLPLSVAAFAPATISLLMGLTALLYLEDG